MKSHTAYVTFETTERRESIRTAEEVHDEPGRHAAVIEWLDGQVTQLRS